jgi:transcriptional regulator GlxA family with amidase domain
MISAGVLVFDGVEELDFVGPYEVLAAWHHLHPDEIDVFTVALADGPVTCAKGLRVWPHHVWDGSRGLDLLVYPGGIGTRAQLGDEQIASWLRALRDDGALLASVCTGALVFAVAGLLDGRPATTHWASTDLLASLGQGIEVRAERFVDAGDVITAAGVSAGIDLALHLVARLHSPARAAEVRRYIHYDPEPPV